ncbi:M14 family metallopeptidase [Rhodocytophaga aerolata]|uniref:M14 family metallopeptidase n=1 Tax=Rhodocytophaga aerolata TaxID=455078 RepID=A0ABT8R8T7_9BACT|nr:M14 family metallopeptidase [Rhodocytophaga aerolata]MDO1448507.1 M14 family metallopeptidase [Rhodocytophaga aerolata]
MKYLYLFVFFYFSVYLSAFAQQIELSYYLPGQTSYDPAIPTPEAFLGYQVGEWHVTHDQLVAYMRELDRVSDRITLVQYARTYEFRPLLLLTISSPQNHTNIDQIKAQHRDLSDPAKASSLNVQHMPAVVWMGYSVHGNEPSGTNASLVVAYHLAAAKGPTIDSLLNETVILLDPSFNPDGMNRFASWVNTHKSKNLVTDPYNRELNEVWPNGRTNHYWFDLNRDWLYVQHPESQGRIAKFHEWKPNVLTDHHEMGTNSTFFFQPGEPTRINPLTPQKNRELTARMGDFHAKALDKIGSLYFTGENYDDFYYGKGSTFPDVNGAVGILFEQASSRGHAQESVNGVLRFPFTIRNQVTTSFSTLAAVRALRLELLNFQRDFYKSSAKEGAASAIKGYVFGSKDDPVRTYQMLKILQQHQIEVYQLGKSMSQNGKTFDPQWAYAIPTNQPKYRLLRGIFDLTTTFEDSLFYDISAWSLPMAFNMPYIEAKSAPTVGKKVEKLSYPEGKLYGSAEAYAYVFSWKGYYAPRAVHSLLQQGYQVRVATEPITTMNNGKQQLFDYGSILLPIGTQTKDKGEIHTYLQELAKRDGIEIYGLETGLTPEGLDLGSASFAQLALPKVLLLVGTGVNANDAGEVWHLLDQRYNMPPTMVDIQSLNRVNLSKYTTVVMVGGNYNSLGKMEEDKLRAWIQAGGSLISMTDAISWVINKGFSTVKLKNAPTDSLAAQRSYAQLERFQGAQLIAGAIFQARLDRSHPLAFGYPEELIPVFRDHTLFIEKPKNPYAAPLMYTNNPLISGYVHPANEKQLRNSAGIVVSNLGAGRVILMADNPNFRAFWYGTNKLFMNAIFFAPLINASAGRVD